MRHWPVARFGNHALKSSARKSEALSDPCLADPTAGKGMKPATGDAGIKHATVEVIT
jgi:hypothetical protein